MLSLRCLCSGLLCAQLISLSILLTNHPVILFPQIGLHRIVSFLRFCCRSRFWCHKLTTSSPEQSPNNALPCGVRDFS